MPASGSEDRDDSQIPSTRVERLLRERVLRKNRDHDVSTDYESDEGRERKPIKQRLLVVANRLPLSAKRNEDDSWSVEISAGGLVSALVGVKDFEARYIGWPGVSVPDDAGQQALTAALSEKRCIPVFLSEEIVNQYYNGYCNDILWPLFHYLELPHEDRLVTTKTSQSQFEAYKTANTMFADVVNEHYQEGDIVWCHDYHLMFLPRKLKEYNFNIKVGWFLHAPFPSSEIFRTLPSRSELLCAVLAADLVGFHTYDYARHFQSACTRILGLEETSEGVKDQGRVTRVAEFPIGIDSDRFIHALEDPQVQDQIMKYKEQFSGKKVILSVDCLHTIKGIPLKILAFEKFLNENQDWHNKVVLLQIAVPTRTEVPQYIKLMSQVHTIVEKVNRRFKTLTAEPVHHLDHSLDFHALCALYSLTDVALLTSSRDGMNLVSYEFVACQDSKEGVLILNKFAGAAQSLGAGAIRINPWNITEVAAAIGQALNMSAQERGKRHQCNFKHVTTHTAQKWAELFLCELNDTAQQRTREASPKLVASDAVGRYLQSNSSLSAYMPASASKDSDDSQISTTRVERLLRERVLRKNRDDTTLNPSIVKVDNQCATTKDFVLGNYKLEGKIYDRLYSYQKVGLEWLIGLHSKETGGILADEMGLGKTLQICSFLSGLFYSNLVRRVMVVAPATLVDNWIEELRKVGLSKHVRVYAGGLEKIHGAKCILVTSYDMVRIHKESLSASQWDYVIADEGHFIKTPNAQRTKCMHEVPSKQRIIVTGTPMENNLMELYALVDFCCPGLLGDKKSFEVTYKDAIIQGMQTDASVKAKKIAQSAAKRLQDKLKPNLLRRMKKDVLTELPKKEEFVVWLRLTPKQRQGYKDCLDLLRASKRHGVLTTITNLKQICSHPILLTKGKSEQNPEIDSCKISFILFLLGDLIKNKHRVLIFSQSVCMLNLIQTSLTSHGYKFIRIDGSTKIADRKKNVEDFQAGKAEIFLLTSGVGGVGLTLTNADRVILVEPAWNPSTDSQVVDRAHRIGQTKNVIAYRLMTCGTVEEKIYRQQIYKGGLFRSATEDSDILSYFSKEELSDLFSISEDGFEVSATQNKLDAYDHNFDQSTKEHLDFLQSLGIGGLNLHHMLFSEAVGILEEVFKIPEMCSRVTKVPNVTMKQSSVEHNASADAVGAVKVNALVAQKHSSDVKGGRSKEKLEEELKDLDQVISYTRGLLAEKTGNQAKSTRVKLDRLIDKHEEVKKELGRH